MRDKTDIATIGRGSNTKKGQIINFFLHFFCLCLFFSLPEMFLSLDNVEAPPAPAIYLKPVLLVAVFYINYYGVFRFYGRSHWIARAVLTNLLIVAAVSAVQWSEFHFGGRPDMPPGAPHGPGHLIIGLRDFVLYMMTAALAISIRLASRLIEMQRLTDRKIAQQRTDELHRLKMQLRPHFLFNALNSVYALIDRDPEKAKEAIHRICHLLRYVLYETSSTVTLRSELEFIRSFAAIMRIRMAKDSKLELKLDAGDFGDMTVPPLLAINLVENAFKHGRTGQGDTISISVTVDKDGIVSCTTRNRIATPAPVRPGASQGVGLTNLRRRLELLYGNAASLTTETVDGHFIARMTIDLRQEKK